MLNDDPRNKGFCSYEESLDKLEKAESDNRKIYAKLKDELSTNLTKARRKEVTEQLKIVRDEYNKIKDSKRIVRHQMLNNQPERN